jgi:phosphoribosylanthranilate isomerase
MTPRVKICGLRQPEDVEACLELGVELLGFNCWPQSPRYASFGELRSCLASIPARGTGAEVVLVFVRPRAEEIRQLLIRLELPPDRVWIQLHGDEDLAYYRNLGSRVIQVLRLSPEPARASTLPAATRVLVEARHPGFGGSGRTLDPRLVDRLHPSLPREWLLAGGLTPENVASAIARLQPWGVDVASGVEKAPGEKDHGRMRAFMNAVREPKSAIR